MCIAILLLSGGTCAAWCVNRTSGDVCGHACVVRGEGALLGYMYMYGHWDWRGTARVQRVVTRSVRRPGVCGRAGGRQT